MANLPPVVFLSPIVALVLIVALPLLRKGLMASTDRKYAEFRLSGLAQRLRLRIVEGDPELNLIQANTVHAYKGLQSTGAGAMADFRGDGVKQTRVRLLGAPFGRPMEFVYYSRTEVRGGLEPSVAADEFECRLSMEAPPNVPAFEIVTRSRSAGSTVAPMLGLPRQSFGDGGLDAHAELLSNDPRLGPSLAAAAAGLRAHPFVHLRCLHGRLSSLATPQSAPSAIHQLVATQRVLTEMAEILWRGGGAPATVHHRKSGSTMNNLRLRELALTPRERTDGLGYKPWVIFWNTRKSWLDAMRNGPLVLTAVIQANRVLYNASTAQPAPAVIVYTADPARRLDADWIESVVERVQAVKAMSHRDAPELHQVQQLLVNERSTFKVTLPLSLSAGVPTTMQVVTLMPENLPGGAIPPDGIVPAILGRNGDLFDLKPPAYV